MIVYNKVEALRDAHEEGTLLYNEIKRIDEKMTADDNVMGRSRELSIVHTKLEEAMMWLEKHNQLTEQAIIQTAQKLEG